ncbi:hypothetical protein TPChic_0082a [Treponema pallidum subsp. pallidum str. Chicago]|nr:hypothetical protein TPChic_0082a [Treponema pallidum subsp. pallidum str. Chicago]
MGPEYRRKRHIRAILRMEPVGVSCAGYGICFSNPFPRVFYGV